MKHNITIESDVIKTKIFVDNKYIGALYHQKSQHQLYWCIEDQNGNTENHLTNMVKATEQIFKKAFPTTYKNYSYYYNNEFEENK